MRDKNLTQQRVAERTRELLAHLGMSARKMAAAVGVDSTFLSAVARGDSMPSIMMVVGLEEEFGVSSRWYLTGEGPMLATTSPASASVMYVREPEASYDAGPAPELHRLLDAALREATPAQVARLRDQLQALAGSPESAGAARRTG